MFHINLKNKRLLSGLSQKQVAEFLQISPQSISKWEKGEAKPSIDYLPALADCFSCEINDFFAPIEENEYLKLLESLFIYWEKELADNCNHHAMCIYLAENPACIDCYSQFKDEINKYKTIRLTTLQTILSCSAEKAQTFLNYLLQNEMIAELDEKGTYFVIPDAIGGLIPVLKIMRDLGEHLLKE